MNLTEIKPKVCEDTVHALRIALEMAERGEIRNVALVTDSDDSYFTICGYSDVGTILGRLQMAILEVYKNV